MRLGPSPWALAPAALAALVAAAWPAALAERRILASDDLHDVVYNDAAGEYGPSNGATQKIHDSDPLSADYSFKTFNGDKLSLKFELAKAAFDKYAAGFGYSEKEIQALKAWKDQARKQALAKAVSSHQSQSQLNDAVSNIQREYERKQADYLASRRFVLGKDHSVEADVPRYVRDSAAIVDPVAKRLDDYATTKRYDAAGIVEAVASLVQTAMIYRVPPNEVGEMHTGGILPPAESLLRGWGDCDTKSAAAGSILKHWPSIQVLGVAVPDHYLLAVLLMPQKGDLVVEYNSVKYVLVEPAGPAWFPPGTVAASTAQLLERQDAYKLEPFF